MNRFMLAAVLTVGVICTPLAGQTSRELTNPQVFPESFGMISGLRELPDGRVLVGDPLGQALILVDMTTGTADTIGSVGGGPREYQQPDRLFALPGDSTLLTDLGNGRLTILSPTLEFVATMPITRPGSGGGLARVRRSGDGPPGAEGPRRRVVRAGPGPGGGPPGGGPTFVLPQAVDAQGRVYFRVMSMGGGFSQDSGYVGRWDRANDQIDTVASFKMREMERQESGGADNQRVMIRPKPLSAEDDWSVGPDGRVAVARAADYRVDWFQDNRVTRGPEVRYRPVRVGRDEKERWLGDSGSGIQVSVAMDNGAMRTAFGRGGGGGRPTRGELSQYQWPDVLPPFRSGRAMVAPDGTMWVERYSAVGEPMQFDLFDGQGRLSGEVKVGPGRRLVGFGDGVAYLAARDEFDLEYLEKYTIR